MSESGNNIARNDPKMVLFYFFLIVFIAFTGIYAYREYKIRQFTTNGVETDASVVRVFIQRDIKRRSVPDYAAEVMYMHKKDGQKDESESKNIKFTKTSSGEFRFELKPMEIDAGNLVKGSIPLDQDEYNTLNPGDIVRVLYLPSNPDEAILATQLHRKGQIGILITGLISLALSGFMLYRYRKSLKTN